MNMKGIPAGKNKGKNVSGYGAGLSPTGTVGANVASKGAIQAKKMPGPTSPGQPSAMKKALAKKSIPNKGL